VFETATVNEGIGEKDAKRTVAFVWEREKNARQPAGVAGEGKTTKTVLGL
jgi:hypothetical protein